MHVHFESLTSNPKTFQIDRSQIDGAMARFPDVARTLTVSRGEDLKDLDAWAPETEALVTAFNVLTQPNFPLRSLGPVFPKLRWIHLTSAGIDKVLPLDWLPPRVLLTNSSGIHSRKAIEYAFMSLVALNMKLPQIVGQQGRSEWKQIFTPSIVGRTVAVIGLGGLGTAAAAAAKQLGMRVLGVRRGTEPHPGIDRQLTYDQLFQALGEADIVYVAVPLTPETRGLIGAAALAAMKPGAALVNVSRGAVVDAVLLAEALRAGRLSGAMLDVFDPEPLPATSPLWTVPNLIMTPHIGMDEIEDYIPRALTLFFESVPGFRAGTPLPTTIDRKLGY
jgi:phosphoglycerate dehydrogenase-like enzyme